MQEPPFVPLSVPVLNGREWQYVKECLDTGWVSSVGKYVDRFEREFAAYAGAKYAVACVNGTSALHLALAVAGVTPGDEVLVPTLTFIATVNAIHYCGAKPVFFDCDDFYCVDPEAIRAFLETETVVRDGVTRNRRTNSRIAAFVPVHVFGNAVDFAALIPELRDRNIAVVEDAAESLGTVYTAGEHTGKHTGTIGSLGCFSFNGNKIITCGGGGMVITDDEAFAARLKYLSTQAKDDAIHFVHNEIGYNHRLTNIQAAIGVAQLEQIGTCLSIKERNYRQYAEAIAGISGLRLAPPAPWAKCNLWFYALQIAPAYNCSRDTLMQRLQEHHIQARPVWRLNHLQKPYADAQSFRIRRAAELYENTLNLPCSVDLRAEDLQRVVAALEDPGPRHSGASVREPRLDGVVI